MNKECSEKFKHYPVLLNETIEYLNCKPGLTYVDATLGGGGHSYEIATRILPDGQLYSFDVDPDALESASQRLKELNNVKIVKANYNKIPEILKSCNTDTITGGIVFDLGASFHQLTSSERGFSFLKESDLDMRFDPENDLTASDIVNNFSESELVRIFSEYGEEKFSKRIAKKIIEKREKNKIKTTTELAEIIKSSVPCPNKYKIHPATRVFQAIRIAVNNELTNFENSFKSIIPILGKQSRICVISFHSLEDRLVKNLFKYYSLNCRCRPHDMICTCPPGQLQLITKKPIIASEEELKLNPPSRSAKLRVAEKV